VSAESLSSAVATFCQGPDGTRVVLTLYSSRAAAFSPFHARLLSNVVAVVGGRSSRTSDQLDGAVRS